MQTLLQEDKPHVVGSDGTRHRFDKNEIETLSKLLAYDDTKRLKLPLYIEIKSMNSGFKISGKIETSLICKILEIEECSDPLFIYRNDLKKIRKKLPSTTQYIFMV